MSLFGGVGSALKSVVSGGADLLLGAKTPGIKGGVQPLTADQKTLMAGYRGLLNTNMDDLASSQLARAETGLRASAEDSARSASGMVASRGLGNSSVGLNAILNQGRDLGNQIATLHSSLPQMQYDMKVQNLNNATNGIQGILNSRYYQQGSAPQGRQGGLIAPAIGAAATYYGLKGKEK